jgi:hypothetical protein
MPDDKTQRGKADRERISAGQRHEVAHVVKTTGKTPQ